MLSRSDLDAIRQIVREELDQRLGDRVDRVIPEPVGDTDGIDPNSKLSPEEQREIEERVEVMVAMMRGAPGAEERFRRLNARQNLKHSPWWQSRARKHLGKGRDDAISEDEMLETMKAMEARRKARGPRVKRR